MLHPFRARKRTSFREGYSGFEDGDGEWSYDERNAWHRMGEYGKDNVKYIHGDGREAVYNSTTGELVDYGMNRGSYNFSNELMGHTMFDGIPYILWGNGPGDSTRFIDRITFCQFGCVGE